MIAQAIAACCPCCGWRPGIVPYTVDLNRNALLYQGRTIKLSPVECEVAAAISKTYPNPMHRERIMALVWPGKDYENDVFGNIVSIYVSKLKRRLAGTGLQIRNFHSRGYVIEEAEL